MNAIKMTLAVGLLLAVTNAGWAQSAYTTGTVDSNARAGYPSPYGYGGLYAYAPGYYNGRVAMHPRPHSHTQVER